LTTSTLLLTESKASKTVRLGEMAMRPGEVPALTPPLTSVSFSPLISTSPGADVALDTLCEARTRVVREGAEDPPQDTKLKLAITNRAGKRADFFKRQAPNYRKTRDLSAKYGIITERPSPALAAAPLVDRNHPRPFLSDARIGAHPVF
jgi:hypothetical protein